MRGGGYPAHYAHVFEALCGLEGNGRSWRALCPAHDDECPSLSLALGARGQLLLKCHKADACSRAAILAALGVCDCDLFVDNRKGGLMSAVNGKDHSGKDHAGKDLAPAGKLVTVYDYREEQGALLYQVCRWQPKSFSCRRRNPHFNSRLPRDRAGNPEYLPGLADVRRVLYRLPELVCALKECATRWVFVVEGERDVDTALAHGLVATCNPLGAGPGKWLSAYSESLRGCNVVVIPDEDQPGYAHANNVCRDLLGRARSVRLVRLPGLTEHGDFADWWAQMDGQDMAISERKKMLLGLINQARPFTSQSVECYYAAPDWVSEAEALVVAATVQDAGSAGEIEAAVSAASESASGDTVGMLLPANMDQLRSWWGDMAVDWFALQQAVALLHAGPVTEVDYTYLQRALARLVATASGLAGRVF